MFGKIKFGRARPRPAPRVQARRDAGGADDRLLDARWLHGGVTLDAAGRGEIIRMSRPVFPNYFLALIYIKAKSQKTTCLHCTERADAALKLLCALLTNKH